MTTQKLSKKERRILRKQQRPAFILAMVLLLGTTTINLILSFPDIATGLEKLDRPPISQFLIVEAFSFVLALATFYFLTKKVIKDLSNGVKNIDKQTVVVKFVKNNAGKPDYTVRLQNAMIISVDKVLFKSIDKGSELTVEYAPGSQNVFAVQKV
jgi:hypothetical protein